MIVILSQKHKLSSIHENKNETDIGKHLIVFLHLSWIERRQGDEY